VNISEGKTSSRIWFVTRHPGAQQWLCLQGMEADEIRAHLDTSEVQPGDTVIGSLPVHLAAAVCERGARYINLSLDLPRELRGRELTMDDMIRCHARLEEFQVRKTAVN